MYSRSPFASSPPTPSFRSDIFGQSSIAGSSQIYGTSPTAERHPDRNGIMPSLQPTTSDPVSFAGADTRPAPAVVIRRLPRNIGNEALRSMLIFAGDLVDTEFIRSPYPEDAGYATAVARFQTSTGALEAQQKLHGKPNTTKEASMIVEAHSTSSIGAFERRNTIDGTASRTQNSSASSGGAGRSRFNSTFQTTTERLSPPLPTSSSGGNGDFPNPESSAHFQNLFSPQSPLANGVDGHSRISGKSVINDDSVDDETGDILKDPVAYAKSGQQPSGRRATNPTLPIGRFGSLSLGSPNALTSPTSQGFPTQRGNGSISGPSSQASPSGNPNGTFSMPGFARPQYPPVNPADQNPPCNTLYVGNLPIDTSEDELKSLFSKQRGYKRLCFRTKQNGPMCFVEFEDISFATKALHELYGHPLHNSVKGGIRLSFSKNPLGVRSNQINGVGASTPMSPQAMSPGYTGMANGANFSAVSGPPPGLGTPPGLNNGAGYRAPHTGMDGMFSNPFSVPSQDFVSQVSPRNYSGGVPQPLGAGTFGRDSRGYTDYALGR
ncbi:hypothetical protein AC579_3437 [Pseudocercospora musae]|uniref:RRM domain-containing protein n=1 Tax=Pseudocercospora musae TaxID=113226 RepID=A0A139IBZ7_9PEZI|nr:hypothetical protein AC579_3437 [Pseudocercospora musae]